MLTQLLMLLRCLGSALSSSLLSSLVSWKLVDDVAGTRIYLRDETFGSHSNSVFKGEGVVACPPHIAVELLMDSQKKPQWDSIFEGAIGIEELTEHIKFEHMVSTMAGQSRAGEAEATTARRAEPALALAHPLTLS